MQHKYAPEHPQAKAFYAMFDRYLADLDALGAAIVVTADHGMKPKHHADGSPSVIYMQDALDDWLGKDAARVILPITDPYVVHHGSLGSFATAYLPADADKADVMARAAKIDGMILVVDKDEAIRRFELPGDRIGGHRDDFRRKHLHRHVGTSARSRGAERTACAAMAG